MVLWFIVAYLVASVAIGLVAARRVSSTADYAVAGRRLPLVMVVTTTFATWFGSEAVLGASAVFMQHGLGGVVEDPFGAAFCLILVGMFFAAKLYRYNFLTIGDYYRERYGTLVEVLMSGFIILSYLGWVAAQIKALGLVFHMLDPALFSEEAGMIIGMLIVMIYTLFGGMWSVALTDFFQMIVIVLGLVLIAYFATDLAGGVHVVVEEATRRNLLDFFPDANLRDVLFFIAALITMMLGSIPQQDVYQRVMSAKNVQVAQRGPILGGSFYLLFALVPMYIGVAAFSYIPETVDTLLAQDPQKVLPAFILGHMPLAAQVLFFGALLSAIMSTASATLLAPSTSFVENLLRYVRPGMSDQASLLAMRTAVVIFALCVLAFALASSHSIYEMVAGAYTVTLVGAFVPLFMGLYWKRATTQGALLAVLCGVVSWQWTGWGYADAFPPQLAGLLGGFGGMFLGSLLPQWIRPKVRPSLYPEEADQAQQRAA